MELRGSLLNGRRNVKPKRPEPAPVDVALAGARDRVGRSIDDLRLALSRACVNSRPGTITLDRDSLLGLLEGLAREVVLERQAAGAAMLAREVAIADLKGAKKCK